MIQVFALISLAVLLAYKFILVFIQPTPTAPEAKGNIPWLPFGLSAAVEFGKDPVRFLQRQNKLLGNVFRANLIALECFFVFGAKAQAIFFRAHNNVLNFDEAMEQLIGETGVIGNEKDEWPKLSNTMIKKGFMKQERVDAYAKIAQEEIRRALKDWANLKRFDLFDKSSELTLRIGMRCMVGDRFTDMHAERVIPLYQQFERDLANPLRKLLPAFLPIPCRTRARSTRDTIGKLISEEIKMREKEADEGKTFVRNDYLEFLLHSKEAGKRFAHIFPEHIVLLIMASHTNTTGTMAWTISNLVASPKDMAAASDEISTVIPKETLISTQQQKYVELPPFSALPFLEGCLKETGRSYSLLFLFRKTSQDVLIENVVIPKGVLVACSPVVTQTDEKLYDSPESYNPSRWALQERAKSATESSEKDDGISFVQFGHGRHRCLGEKFALMILKSMWVLLLGAYRVEFADAFTHPSEATKGYTANAKHDVRVGVPDFLSTIGTPWPFNPVWMKIQPNN